MDFNPGINNKKWQLILIPLIAFTTASVISYSSSSEYSFPYRLFIILSIFILCIWQVNLITYRWLDKRMAFYDEPGKRLLIQIAACCIATWITFTALYFTILVILNGGLQNFPFRDYALFFIIATIISIIINSFYIIRYLQSTLLYKEAISTEKMNKLLVALEQKNNELPKEKNIEREKTVSPPKSMIIETGAKTINISFNEMAYWYSSDGIVILVLKDGKKITTNFTSFNAFVNKLPTDIFFQLNRQFITHLQSIVSITDDTNRKLIVVLSATNSTNKNEEVTVSRYRSQELKTWFADKIN